MIRLRARTTKTARRIRLSKTASSTKPAFKDHEREKGSVRESGIRDSLWERISQEGIREHNLEKKFNPMPQRCSKK